MMAIYLVGTGVATIATGFSENSTQLILGLSSIGFFASIYHPVGTAFVVRHASNRALDLGRNGAWGTAGLALSAFIAAGLLHGSWIPVQELDFCRITGFNYNCWIPV